MWHTYSLLIILAVGGSTLNGNTGPNAAPSDSKERRVFRLPRTALLDVFESLTKGVTTLDRAGELAFSRMVQHDYTVSVPDTVASSREVYYDLPDASLLKSDKPCRTTRFMPRESVKALFSFWLETWLSKTLEPDAPKDCASAGALRPILELRITHRLIRVKTSIFVDEKLKQLGVFLIQLDRIAPFDAYRKPLNFSLLEMSVSMDRASLQPFINPTKLTGWADADESLRGFLVRLSERATSALKQDEATLFKMAENTLTARFPGQPVGRYRSNALYLALQESMPSQSTPLISDLTTPNDGFRSNF